MGAILCHIISAIVAGFWTILLSMFIKDKQSLAIIFMIIFGFFDIILWKKFMSKEKDPDDNVN